MERVAGQTDDMNDQKKRPWFQFHLSTLIMVTFVAGGLIWANVRVWKPSDTPDNWKMIGWPFAYRCSLCKWGEDLSVVCFGPTFIPEHFAADIGIAIVILIAVFVALEYLIRRKEYHYE
jgi:hypothetical protein